MPTERERYDELCAYTLTHGDPAFIHQHVVDAFAAQNATESSKPIGVFFALVGLYLHTEKGISGRDVQRIHMRLAQRKRQWPAIALPRERGATTAGDVMAAPAGPERDRAIDAWAAAVWNAFRDTKPLIDDVLQQHGIRV